VKVRLYKIRSILDLQKEAVASLFHIMENETPLPLRVAIVDDHIMVSEMLALSISKEEDLTLVGVAGSVIEALKLIKREHPSVILMNYRLLNVDCLDLVREVLKEDPDTRIVLLSGSGNPDMLKRALDAGCVGLLGKDCPITEVLGAIRSASRGEIDVRRDQFSKIS
jgi:DNA-binding NarL/FixJ family response regulator